MTEPCKGMITAALAGALTLAGIDSAAAQSPTPVPDGDHSKDLLDPALSGAHGRHRAEARRVSDRARDGAGKKGAGASR